VDLIKLRLASVPGFADEKASCICHGVALMKLILKACNFEWISISHGGLPTKTDHLVGYSASRPHQNVENQRAQVTAEWVKGKIGLEPVAK
jgi:hypothetical protein